MKYKWRIRVDLELRYANTEFEHLLELTSFLDPRLNFFNRGKVLEEVEKQMLANVINDQITTLSTSVETIDEDSEPPIQRPKSKIFGHCLGHRSSAVLPPHQQVKHQMDQYLSHPHSDVEESPMNWWKTE